MPGLTQSQESPKPTERGLPVYILAWWKIYSRATAAQALNILLISGASLTCLRANLAGGAVDAPA